MKAENVAAAFRQLLPSDLEFGAMAYPMYHAAMRRFATHYRAPFVQTVEAFVALSPNNDYHGNLRSLASVLAAARDGRGVDSFNVTTYRACAIRAMGYITGQVSFLDTVRGPKITAFRHNILYPHTSRRVTVDGHMIGVWHGENLTMKQAAALMVGPAHYARIEADFLTIARRVKLQGCALQAALWTARKRERGVKYEDQVELFSGLTRLEELPDPQDYPPIERIPA